MPTVSPGMIIVTGHLLVADRDSYLLGCRTVVELARTADGCLDFALSPDLLDDRRINILERWSTPDQLAAFRGDGVGEDQAAQILTASVEEYDVPEVRPS